MIGVFQITWKVVDVVCEFGPADLIEFPARVKTLDALVFAAYKCKVLFRTYRASGGTKDSKSFQ